MEITFNKQIEVIYNLEHAFKHKFNLMGSLKAVLLIEMIFTTDSKMKLKVEEQEPQKIDQDST